MASTTKPARKSFALRFPAPPLTGARSSRSTSAMRRRANPDVYGARVNVEHYLSMLPDSNFGAMGMLWH